MQEHSSNPTTTHQNSATQKPIACNTWHSHGANVLDFDPFQFHSEQDKLEIVDLYQISVDLHQ